MINQELRTQLVGASDYMDAILKQVGAFEADSLMNQLKQEIDTDWGYRLSNDRIRYYILNISHYMYKLGESIARVGLHSDIITIYHDKVYSELYAEATDESGKKLTREDKTAIAKIESEAEAITMALYKQATKAVEQRIMSLAGYRKTLEMLATMNMSETRLESK